MRRVLFFLSCLLAIGVCGAEQLPPPPGPAPDEEFRSRMRDIHKRRNELQKQLDALDHEEDTLRKEWAARAEEKKYYIKVEVKGRLSKGITYALGGRSAGEGWIVSAQEVYLQLDLHKDRKLLEAVKPLENKSVQITGSLVSRAPESEGSVAFLSRPVLVVSSLKAAE